MKVFKNGFYLFVVFGILLTALSLNSAAQPPQPLAAKLDRDRGQEMLKLIKMDLKKNYYDTNLRGMDLEARFKAASEKIDQATSNGHIMGIIAQVLFELDDSHTRFIPPPRAARTEYGWTMQLVGDKTFVTAVKPGSDAEKKGLKVGDEIWSIDGFAPLRDNIWKIKYFYYSLRPQPGMKLVVKRPSGKEEEIIVMAKITTGKKVMDLTGNDVWDLIRQEESEDYLRRHRYGALGEEVFVWKMPQFDMTEAQVDDMMDKVKKYPSLILDLRGNGGGAVRTLNRLVGHFFDRDVKIADWKGRKEFDPQIAKTRGEKFYKGKVVVLVDSESGSASEIFARVMQLEKRAVVLGDRSAGAVMVSRYYPRQIGLDVVAFFGSSITEADLIMTDGKSLEKIGVVPDETVLPSAEDIAAGKDTVLARAAALLGAKLDASEAGKMFPFEWGK
ncbi:MAG TPA: S41 family peptidase [Pyrinomonadaceae bacterium]|jgi:carboxyl-terminal processing protease